MMRLRPGSSWAHGWSLLDKKNALYSHMINKYTLETVAKWLCISLTHIKNNATVANNLFIKKKLLFFLRERKSCCDFSI